MVVAKNALVIDQAGWRLSIVPWSPANASWEAPVSHLVDEAGIIMLLAAAGRGPAAIGNGGLVPIGTDL